MKRNHDSSTSVLSLYEIIHPKVSHYTKNNELRKNITCFFCILGHPFWITQVYIVMYQSVLFVSNYPINQLFNMENVPVYQVMYNCILFILSCHRHTSSLYSRCKRSLKKYKVRSTKWTICNVKWGVTSSETGGVGSACCENGALRVEPNSTAPQTAHSWTNTSLKQHQQKLNIVTFVKGGFIAGLLY